MAENKPTSFPYLDSIQIADIVWLSAVLNTNEKADSQKLDSDIAEDNNSGHLVDSSERPSIENAFTPPLKKPSKVSNNTYKNRQTRKNNDILSLHASGAQKADSSKKGTSIKIPTVPVSNYLLLARSLKALRKKTTSKTNKAININESIDRYAETGIFLPIYQKNNDNWWEILLVIDTSKSMLPWKDYLDNLKKILEQNGTFESINTCYLNADGDSASLHLSRDKGSLRTYKPTTFSSTSRKQIILIASDCVSKAWHNSSVLEEIILVWQKTEIVSILQMLPRKMWPGTALSKAHDIIFHSNKMLTKNASLISEDDWQWEDDYPDYYNISSNLAKIPIITTDPKRISGWGHMLCGKPNYRSYGRLFDVDRFRELAPANQDKTLCAEKSIELLYSQTSTSAQILAEYLTAFTVVSIPLIRLVQELVLPESNQLQIAEVLLGGLFVQVSEDLSGPIYKFKDGVREQLSHALGIREEAFIKQKIGDFIIRKFGHSIDHWAVLHDPTLLEGLNIPEQDKGFAEIARSIFSKNDETATAFDTTENEKNSDGIRSSFDARGSITDDLESLGGKIYGLFVGINQYQSYNIKTLFGCANDTELISNLIKERYNLADSNCLILLDEQATKKNIVDGFQIHLAQAKKDDIAIFYYSGHGSTEKADPVMWMIEPDQYNETLVCYDSRGSESYDLADKELRYLIHQLNERGVKVDTIIDSCHSGESTRHFGGYQEKLIVRHTPSNDLTRPLDSYIFFDDPQAKPWLNDFKMMPEGDHIGIYACRDDQLATETYFNQIKYGVFTYSLCNALKFQQTTPSYRDLADLAKQGMAASSYNQSPQLQAVGNRDLHTHFLQSDFEQLTYPLDFVDNQYVLQAGSKQGINVNARLQSLVDNDFAEFRVIKVSDNESVLELLNTKLKLDPNLQYHAAVVDPSMPKLPLSIEGSEENIQQIVELLNSSYWGAYFELNDYGKYLLKVGADHINFDRINGLSLDVDSISMNRSSFDDSIKNAFELAAHMARWEQVLLLAYTADNIPRNTAEVIIKQYDPTSDSFSKINNEDEVFNLRYSKDPHSGELLKPNIKLSVELNVSIANNHTYISLLYMDQSKGSIDILANQEELSTTEKEAARARSIWEFKKPNGGNTATLSIPSHLLDRGNTVQTTDYLKLIISDFPLDISSLKQSSLNQLLSKSSTRSMDLDEEDEYSPVYKSRTQTITLNINKTELVVLLLRAKSADSLLDSLPTEISNLKRLFNTHQPKLAVEYDPYLNQKGLVEILTRFKDRVAILHFAGHESRNKLQTGEDQVLAHHIATLLDTWDTKPRLVFLNGCDNAKQIRAFHRAGVNCVVGTRMPIDDTQANRFANAFYEALLSNPLKTSLNEAFNRAGQKARPRSIDLDDIDEETVDWDWNISPIAKQANLLQQWTFHSLFQTQKQN